MKYFRCFMSFGIVTLLLAGCANLVGCINIAENTIGANQNQQDEIQAEETKESEETKEPEETKESEVTKDSETIKDETKVLPFGYLNYTGYLDECYAWKEYMLFVTCDYDNDGLIDRLYRTYMDETEFCHYRIEFGSGEILDIEKDVYDVGRPEVVGVDLTGDDVNEIILYLTPGMSNEPRAFGDIVVYEKKDSMYQQSILPFIEGEEGYSQSLEIVYSKADGQAIEVFVPHTGFKYVIPIETERWEKLKYKDYYTTAGEESSSVVWSYNIVKDGDDNRLICKIHLFDKWSVDGLNVLLVYQEGQFEMKDIVYCENEFE